MDYSNTFLTCLPASTLMEWSILQSDSCSERHHIIQTFNTLQQAALTPRQVT